MNTSFTTGKVPDTLKIVKVIPTHKVIFFNLFILGFKDTNIILKTI